MRYFKQDLAEYQKGNDHVVASLRPIEEIAKKLAARRITLKVFVMPYEAQGGPCCRRTCCRRE
jgi:hypothetical protein